MDVHLTGEFSHGGDAMPSLFALINLMTYR
jgi:hypothetical protein